MPNNDLTNEPSEKLTQAHLDVKCRAIKLLHQKMPPPNHKGKPSIDKLSAPFLSVKSVVKNLVPFPVFAVSCP